MRGIIRFLISIPILTLGIILFKIAEFIANDKFTYRSDEVKEAVLKRVKSATCKKCGHTGEPEFIKNN